MSVAHLLTVLENDEFIERIQKRPEAFIGTTGLVGLENLLVQTINGLLEFFIEKNQGKIAIQLSRQQISFQVSSTRPLVFEQKQVDLEPPFLYLSVLQAFSKQVGISIDQEKLVLFSHAAACGVSLEAGFTAGVSGCYCSDTDRFCGR